MILYTLTACTKPYGWVPEQVSSQQYFHFSDDSGSPYCHPQCQSFEVYIFENGEIAYFGGKGLRTKGWRFKQLSPDLFLQIETLLEQHRFEEWPNNFGHYGYNDETIEQKSEEACGKVFLTHSPSISFEAKTTKITKIVGWDDGCHKAKYRDTILHFWRKLKVLLPLEEWVGAEFYHFRKNQIYKKATLK